MKILGFLGLVALGAILPATGASAQVQPLPDQIAPGGLPAVAAPAPQVRKSAPRRAPAPDLQASLIETANANTVSIISGTPGATYFRIASDLAFTLDDGDNLRILPILGKGAQQNGYDLLFLKGVDIGLVRTDTLELLKSDKRISNPAGQLVYIARLFNDEMHVIAGSDITDIHQLAGRKVSFDVRGSGTSYTGRIIFQALGIQVEAVDMDQPAAQEALKRGELGAVVSVAAKPVSVISSFKSGGKFHLVPVPYPASVADRYFPASLAEGDYPDLVAKGETVNTIAVGTILGAYNWPENTPRYKRIARFVDAFFSKFDELQKVPRHPKWQEVNLAATVQGWTRFKPAQQWLDRTSAPAAAVAPGGDQSAAQFALFRQFLAVKNIDPATSSAAGNQERLFKEFLEWNRTRKP